MSDFKLLCYCIAELLNVYLNAQHIDALVLAEMR